MTDSTGMLSRWVWTSSWTSAH